MATTPVPTIINFDFGKATRQAQQIDDIADDLNSIATKTFNDAINSIHASWKSEAANMFLEHCEATRSDILNRVKELRDIAQKIRAEIKRLKEAEEKAKQVTSVE